MAPSRGSGGPAVGAARRGGAQVEGEAPGGGAPGEDVDAGALGEGELCAEVGAAAEAVEAEPAVLGEGGTEQGAVADDAGAEQRGERGVADAAGQRVGEGGGDGGVLRVAAVGVPAGVAGGGAEVLVAAPAEAAGAVGGAEPGDAHPVTDGVAVHVRPGGGDHADHLVPRGDVRPVHGQVALGDVQVGAADPAGADVHQEFAGARGGHGFLHVSQGLSLHRPRFADLPRVHRRGHGTGHLAFACPLRPACEDGGAGAIRGGRVSRRRAAPGGRPALAGTRCPCACWAERPGRRGGGRRRGGWRDGAQQERRTGRPTGRAEARWPCCLRR